MSRPNKTFGYIYMTTNTINNKKYIGLKTGNYTNSYYGSGKLLKQAVKKYGKENFIIDVLEIVDTGDISDLFLAEIKWISYYNADTNSDYYNILKGGDGFIGYTHSKEVRLKMSIKNKGEGNPMYGRKHTIESIEKGKRTKKERSHLAKKPEFTDKKRKALKLVNENKKNRPKTEKELAASLKGLEKARERKKILMIQNPRRIIGTRILDGIEEIYNSVSEAGLILNKNNGKSASISHALNGRSKSSFGRTWRYQ